MGPDTQRIVLEALDEALAQHVLKLFDVLMSEPSEDGYARFMAGLNQGIGVHEELRSTLSQDDSALVCETQPAPDSSGPSF
jgi:hypothetical protein